MQVNENKDFEPVIVAFCCNWCSYAGADGAGVGGDVVVVTRGMKHRVGNQGRQRSIGVILFAALAMPVFHVAIYSATISNLPSLLTRR